jgi:hypothetical protein
VCSVQATHSIHLFAIDATILVVVFTVVLIFYTTPLRLEEELGLLALSE